MPAIALQSGGPLGVLAKCGAVVRTLGCHAIASRVLALLNVFRHLYPPLLLLGMLTLRNGMFARLPFASPTTFRRDYLALERGRRFDQLFGMTQAGVGQSSAA